MCIWSGVLGLAVDAAGRAVWARETYPCRDGQQVRSSRTSAAPDHWPRSTTSSQDIVLNWPDHWPRSTSSPQDIVLNWPDHWPRSTTSSQDIVLNWPDHWPRTTSSSQDIVLNWPDHWPRTTSSSQDIVLNWPDHWPRSTSSSQDIVLNWPDHWPRSTSSSQLVSTHRLELLLLHFYVPQLYWQVLLWRVLAIGILSVRPSVTTRWYTKPRWDRDSGSSPYDSLESLVSNEVIWCRWERRFPSNEGIKRGTPP